MTAKKTTTNELSIAVSIGYYQNKLLFLLGLWSFLREEREKAMISQSRSVYYSSEHSAVQLIVRETRHEVEREGRIEKKVKS